jgi:hypothetical protein
MNLRFPIKLNGVIRYIKEEQYEHFKALGYKKMRIDTPVVNPANSGENRQEGIAKEETKKAKPRTRAKGK